jgi:hypothetical protein
MSEVNEVQLQEEVGTPEIIVNYEAECASLTGRSVLTFQAGRHPKTNVPMLRIARNSGGGMFCKEWASIELIDAVLDKADPVTARTFNEVHPGRSINTGGFILAILKDLGVVKSKDDNTRHQERVGGTTVLKALAGRLAESQVPINHKSRRTNKPE